MPEVISIEGERVWFRLNGWTRPAGVKQVSVWLLVALLCIVHFGGLAAYPPLHYRAALYVVSGKWCNALMSHQWAGTPPAVWAMVWARLCRRILSWNAITSFLLVSCELCIWGVCACVRPCLATVSNSNARPHMLLGTKGWKHWHTGVKRQEYSEKLSCQLRWTNHPEVDSTLSYDLQAFCWATRYFFLQIWWYWHRRQNALSLF